MKKKPCCAKKWLLLIALFFLIAFALSLYVSAYDLSVSRYDCPCERLTVPVRIVLLSDLHNSEFGEGNARLAALVAEQEPDLILLVGDLLNQNEERTDIAVSMICRLAEIAPVYVSFGNHEVEYERRYGADLRELYTKAGARVLDYEWTDVTINGQELRIGGIFGYCLPPELLRTGEAREEECAFLEQFQATDRTTILMCHMPVCWIENGSLDAWDVDLVLSGHAHGGQVRLPWIGGLWAPDQGWFPGRECGLYRSSDRERILVLSQGLGSGVLIPRFNNIPEIVVLDLLPKK